MNVLVVNCGSSSLKYQLLNMENETVIAKGICERIGIDGSFIKHTTEGQDSVKEMVDFPNHKVAIAKVLSMLTEGPTACCKPEEISAVGHRVVHGGEKFNKSVIITEEFLLTKALNVFISIILNAFLFLDIISFTPGSKCISASFTTIYAFLPCSLHIVNNPIADPIESKSGSLCPTINTFDESLITSVKFFLRHLTISSILVSP